MHGIYIKIVGAQQGKIYTYKNVKLLQAHAAMSLDLCLTVHHRCR